MLKKTFALACKPRCRHTNDGFLVDLRRCIPPSMLAVLLARYGGELVYIPSDNVKCRHARNAAIAAAYSAGVSVSNLSVRFGLSQRMIRVIIKNNLRVQNDPL